MDQVPRAHTGILADEPCSAEVAVPLKEGDVVEVVPPLQRGAEGDGREAGAYAGEPAVGYGRVGRGSHRVEDVMLSSLTDTR